LWQPSEVVGGFKNNASARWARLVGGMAQAVFEIESGQNLAAQVDNTPHIGCG
jgi:hypothetical protein